MKLPIKVDPRKCVRCFAFRTEFNPDTDICVMCRPLLGLTQHCVCSIENNERLTALQSEIPKSNPIPDTSFTTYLKTLDKPLSVEEAKEREELFRNAKYVPTVYTDAELEQDMAIALEFVKQLKAKK